MLDDRPWTDGALGHFEFGLKGIKNPRPSARCFGIEKVGRGHAQNTSHHNRGPGVFVIALQEVFSFSEDWHQHDRANRLVRQYEAALDGVLKDDPDVKRYVVHCCHCGLRFLTDPRNAGRRDLRCPFGCREHHRKQRANQRSARYYRTDEGRKNKKLLNGRRSMRSSGGGHDAPHDDLSQADSHGSPAPDSDSSKSQPASIGKGETSVKLQLEGVVLEDATVVNSPVLPYLRILASLLEGRRVGLAELVDSLRQAMRQRSMDLRKGRGNFLHVGDQHPP